VPSSARITVDTTEATVQPDLFNPDREGAQFGGGGLERTQCGTTAYGKTVWYDIAPEVAGGVEILAGGFDTVVAVYEYDARTASITRSLGCVDKSATAPEQLQFQAKAGHFYTVQIGGAVVGGNPAGGMLSMQFTFFQDRDGDGVLDAQPDRCPTLPGLASESGCPPTLTGQPTYSFDRVGGSLRLTGFSWARLPRGARISAVCRRCGARASATSRGSSSPTKLRGLVGAVGRPDARLVVTVSMAPRRTGDYRYGAIGTSLTYKFTAGGLSRVSTRCVLPGKRTPARSCR
jgi:hypothetical protein